ncbi:hypothetical protein VTH8203_03779 [Vibrio thalassae]|uniref:Uncharacterized protein n=1 Tax=Vibrio thalassae TaxID=1243014 RepID=A0A240ENE2_9VIBR|nr:hypothetical protein VTH8203_03779 [Vibrio thalassae]
MATKKEIKRVWQIGASKIQDPFSALPFKPEGSPQLA